ncbi:ATP synthase regulation protein NCA2 [Cordyceps fumosorosea ARSEF 2679]|uniref:ATP synthase regulation protein NCA2 n=1 Tax=Cordyceps fumosorosea (strain ARSEF 2679) TaxID=1081104 RepID=A0A167UA68_CORFA|nr:ATP synthase regulation protein NCA2 [Cordyceps fumosorosea ARSEF 2679]OAA61375.1 ATP synthase regulation protein NCA2 [Cordyceps fumosorosea ARSEF 2679]
MTLVSDQVRRLDAYLDRLPVLADLTPDDTASESADQTVVAARALSSPRIDQLLHLVQSLSSTSSSQALVPIDLVRSLLIQSDILTYHADGTTSLPPVEAKSHYENEAEWLLVTKATVQVYGAILNTLLDRIIPLSDDIWYWSEVLNSYTYSSLYTVQTSPLRLWVWTQEVYSASKTRIDSFDVRDASSDLVQAGSGMTQQWRKFYGIVRESIVERSLANVQRKVLSPLAYCRNEALKKLAELRKLREITASGLGVLMDEGLQFDSNDGKVQLQGAHLKGVVERSVALIDMVLKEVSALDMSIHDFEDKVFAGVEEDAELSVHIEDTATPGRSSVLARRLLNIIDKVLPQHVSTMNQLAVANGRPHAVVRYWIPVVVGVVSSSTILRILVNRKAEIVEWITDFGATIRDFWLNWVVEPTQKIVKTIRHDATSEIAIMSRDSLKADRESLERMVVEFAQDNPQFVVEGSSITDAHVSEIRRKVAEGDVTPVLRAYEKYLKKPLAGAVTGDLVRSLLIQVQKSKVDLEVAMTGIDSLLKSQELVFGFVGLTPGVLVSIGVVRYLSAMLGGRSGRRHSGTAGRAIRILRNIDRILSDASPTDSNMLSYKDHGLLLCELHVLRSLTTKLLPRSVQQDFLEDLDDLANIKGISFQAKALARIRWAYARWLR